MVISGLTLTLKVKKVESLQPVLLLVAINLTITGPALAVAGTTKPVEILPVLFRVAPVVLGVEIAQL